MLFQTGSPTTSLTIDDLREAMGEVFEQLGHRKRVLILPPDATRLFSRAGDITAICYETLGEAVTDIMPALGTHSPMSSSQIEMMFPGVPEALFRPHRWRDDVVTLGEIPADFVRQATGGVYNKAWPAQVNRLLVEGDHDLILSIGQVVPHEVIGMANYNKNVFVGTGGQDGISESHYLSAVVGIDQTLGVADTALRKVLNEAQERFCKDMPLIYVLTVVQQEKDGTKHTRGLFIGDDHDTFFAAAALAREVNITHLPKAPTHVVAYLDPEEFKSTWLGNKAIYRTRKAIATGGKLTILGPAVCEFGEDERIDQMIRKYGYRPRAEIMQLVADHPDLAADPSAAAHLIHGSPENRFDVVYAAGELSDDEIRSVGFIPGDLDALMKRYDVAKLTDGFHTDVDGSEFYFVQNPALGLWEAPI
ncbi:MAG: lactate racemase domain-containing protein [Planctomycetota bacterium]